MIVADNSLLVYFWLPSAFAGPAEAVKDRDKVWASPILWRAEFRNVLAGYLRRKTMTEAEANAASDAANSGNLNLYVLNIVALLANYAVSIGIDINELAGGDVIELMGKLRDVDRLFSIRGKPTAGVHFICTKGPTRCSGDPRSVGRYTTMRYPSRWMARATSPPEKTGLTRRPAASIAFWNQPKRRKGLSRASASVRTAPE